MVSEPRTYGFGTETIKGCRLNLLQNPTANAKLDKTFEKAQFRRVEM